MSLLASQYVISLTALLTGGFLRYGTENVRLTGLRTLHKALEERLDPKGKRPNRGVITICNHNSVVDDPMAWATTFPLGNYWPWAAPGTTCHNTRWTLGARDIMFTNPIFSRFFEWGQVINTERGGGVYQPAVDQAIKLLQEGEWIHIFPEGKVNQQSLNPNGGLLRFKWGVGRMIMDCEEMPEIIPMWLSGFDQIMPEPRSFPRFIPRTGAKVSVNFGPPLTPLIKPLMAEWRATVAKRKQEGKDRLGPGQTAAVRPAPGEEMMRMRITAALQQGLARLGRHVETKEGRFQRGEWTQSTRRKS